MYAYLFSLVPSLDRSEVVIWASGKLELELEAKETIDVSHEVEEGANFFLNLGRHTEYMGIILHEPPHSSQTSQSTRSLIPVNDAEFGHSDWQFLVTPIS